MAVFRRRGQNQQDVRALYIPAPHLMCLKFFFFFDNFYNTAAVYPAPLRTAGVFGKLQKEFNRVYIHIQ